MQFLCEVSCLGVVHDLPHLCSHEATRNTREVGTDEDTRPELVRSAILCHHRGRTLWRADVAHIQSQILRRTARPMDPSDSCTNVTSSLSGKCPAMCWHFLALQLMAAPSLLAFLLDGGPSFFPVPCDHFPREPLSTVCASVSGVDVKKLSLEWSWA